MSTMFVLLPGINAWVNVHQVASVSEGHYYAGASYAEGADVEMLNGKRFTAHLTVDGVMDLFRRGLEA